MMTVQEEFLPDVLSELKPIFMPHWRELALDQDQVQLDPLYEIYLDRAWKGEVLCVTARETDAIAGYFVGFIAPAMHYRHCLTLTMDLFYLAPQYRAEDSLSAIEEEMLAMRLFEEVRKCAQKRGVQRCFYGSKLHKDASRLFEALGLREVERYYSAYWGG
jgi:hypothetical protein